MKKVELHVHLDGSVRPSTVSELLNRDLEDVCREMTVDSSNPNLSMYLTKFDLPLSVMQTKENLTRIAYELASDLKKDEVIYAEVRFAPIFHTKKGLSYDEIINSVLEGFKRVNIKINLLLCMMRGQSMEDNYAIIDLASKYLGKGVCGIDLAGDEYNYKTSLYEPLFREARQRNIPFTIHAGEADGPSSIENALEYGATRIGHGVRCIEDNEIINQIKNKGILLEICPTSNIHTKIFGNYYEHPFKLLYDAGIRLCINTDNRTVSSITLNDEYNHALEVGFSNDDLVKCNIEAIKASFISEEEKEELIKELMY